MSLKTTQKMREYHRYLGFFLAGIMAMYAISGMVLIFRTTDFLKREVQQQEQLAPGLTGEQVGRELRIRDLKVNKTEGDVLFFENGTYNSITGEAQFVKKELPLHVLPGRLGLFEICHGCFQVCQPEIDD